MSRCELLRAAAVLAVGWLGLPVSAQVSEGQAASDAVAAARRAGAETGRVTARDRIGRSDRYTIDERWWVTIGRTADQPTMIVDRDFLKSPHAEHRLDAQPTPEEIDAAGRELVAKVLPDLNMAEFELESATVQPRSAYAEARWRQVIPESGFRGPGMCWVVFCWPDRAPMSICSEDPSIPDEWRRPATVTAGQAEEIARPKLGDLKGAWIETTKGFCAETEATRKGPAWNVMVTSRPTGRSARGVPIRSVFVDPWTGEIIHTTTWKSAGAGPAEARAKPGRPAALPTAPPLTAEEAERSAHGRWLLAAGAGLLVLALAAAMVCARRGRA